MHAMSDAIYVLREHRRSGLGVVLIDKTEADLGKELKKVRIWYHDKANLEMLGPVLAKRGYTHVENCWDKMVEV
jgi:GNAT superfamily N-acetyltransferase